MKASLRSWLLYHSHKLHRYTVSPTRPLECHLLDQGDQNRLQDCTRRLPAEEKAARLAYDSSLCISVPLADEICDGGIGFRQRLFIRQEHDAEVLRAGLLAEAGAMDDHHVLLANQLFDEGLVALGDAAFWKTYAREGVEGAARRDAA